MTIRRTVYTVEVFSDGPLDLDHLTDLSDIEAIAHAITHGACVGDVTETETGDVPANEVEAHLVRIGSEGNFFGDEYLDLADAEPVTPPAPEPVELPDPPLPTIDSMVREAVQDMIDLPEGFDQATLAACLNEVCERAVPSMVTTLGLMLVADNSLGWIDVDHGLAADESGDVNAAHTFEVALAERVKDGVVAQLTDELALEENRNRLAAVLSAFEASGERSQAMSDEADRLARLVDLAEALG